eukprot:6713354-Prymnesium_polylepis.1
MDLRSVLPSPANEYMPPARRRWFCASVRSVAAASRYVWQPTTDELRPAIFVLFVCCSDTRVVTIDSADLVTAV